MYEVGTIKSYSTEVTVFSVEYDQMARHLPTVLFITYAKISTHPVLLTYAKILWAHADHATHKVSLKHIKQITFRS